MACGWLLGREGGTVAGGHTGTLDKILICGGQTGERCRGGTAQLFLCAQCPFSRIIRVNVHESVELWVELFDALEVILGELCGACVSGCEGVVVVGEAFVVPNSHSTRLVAVSRATSRVPGGGPTRSEHVASPQGQKAPTPESDWVIATMAQHQRVSSPTQFSLALGVLPDLLPIIEDQERISHNEPN